MSTYSLPDDRACFKIVNSSMSYQAASLLLAVAVGVAVAAYTYYTSRSNVHQYQTHQRCRSSPRRRPRDNICTVCLEWMHSERTTLPCEHEFHVECISSWIRINKTCPLCRIPI